MDDDFGGKELTAHFQDDTWYSKEKLYKVGGKNYKLKFITPTNDVFYSFSGSCGGNFEKMGSY